MTENTARDLANSLAFYLAAEHSLINNRNAEADVLVDSAEVWVAAAEQFGRLREKARHEVLMAPITSAAMNQTRAES